MLDELRRNDWAPRSLRPLDRGIGEILGGTESRLCQLHGQILKTLRAHLAADEHLFAALAA